MENLIIDELVKDYVSFESLLELAEEVPMCPTEEFPNAGALAKISTEVNNVDFELE